MRNEYEKFEKAGQVLKAVGHPARLGIVAMLEKKEMCVSDIVDKLGIKQAITSQHLNMMRDKGILYSRRDGANVFYGIENKNVIKLLHCIYKSCDNTTEAGE